MTHARPVHVVKLLILLIFVACSSTPTKDGDADVLEPEEAVTAAPTDDTAQGPIYKRLMEKLTLLGYEGMGLQFESEQTLLMLEQVFSDPAMEKRKIRLVYTGLEMSYDPQYESITIGGLTRAVDVVNYIKKKIPLRPQSK